MPTRNKIHQEITQRKSGAQDEVRRRFFKTLQRYSGRDTIVYASAFSSPHSQNLPSDALSITTDDIQGFMAAVHGLRSADLDLVLHSPGGTLEGAEQIVQYLRSKFNHIRVIIPQNAMSAATMIACASDEILMGNHSAIGPIDPQITFPTETGQFTAPAQAIIEEFDEAQNAIINNPQVAVLWANKVRSYQPGLVSVCRKTVELSKERVKEWLERYMFSGDPDARTKANNIAEWLGTFGNHKTHGRPINYELASKNGLTVKRLEEDQKLQEKVLSLFHACAVTFEITSCTKFVENHNGRGRFLSVQSKE